MLFGIPRNLEQVPFVEGSPLYGPFPNGYDCGDECLIDYLYTYGEQHPELYPDAEQNGSKPGIEAMRDAAEGVLGPDDPVLRAHRHAGLLAAHRRARRHRHRRWPSGCRSARTSTTTARQAPAIGYIEAGPQHMNGETALWYARSRYATTDYDRMARQRQVQEAIIAQANPANVLTNFVAIASAGAQVVSTDIPQGMLATSSTSARKTREQPVVDDRLRAAGGRRRRSRTIDATSARGCDEAVAPPPPELGRADALDATGRRAAARPSRRSRAS